MKIIVGLGNPGKEYKKTRHNIGFMVLEEIASRYRVEKEESRFDALIAHLRISGEKVLLVKPLTYMNLSGKSVQPLVYWYKINLEDLMVIYDDMDLNSGILRIRKKGGTGGHNGLKSISERLSSKEFPRIRLGIGRPEHQEASSWVLGKFTDNENDEVLIAVKNAADAVETWVKEGIDKTMNEYN